ncbi:hypothetical protein TMP248_110114 [Tenacibaculum maritimum]|nr:hypothetical protein TMP248_110114 [Tenacibaculum maritimum]CAA0172299.1 hypothetical protein FS0810_140001 [Tenacibaculum maritimum]
MVNNDFKSRNKIKEKNNENDNNTKNVAVGKLKLNNIKNKKSPIPIASKIFFFKQNLEYKNKLKETKLSISKFIAKFMPKSLILVSLKYKKPPIIIPKRKNNKVTSLSFKS